MTADDRSRLDDLADRLFRAFEDNDADTIAQCCAEDASFSQNGGPATSIGTLLPSFASLKERIGQHRYTEVRRGLFDDGFVEEHTVETTLPDGTDVRLRACVVARVDGEGKLIELNEYLDPAATNG